MANADSFLSRVTTTSGLLEQLFAQTKMGMVLSDPRAPDNPIIACNDAFCAMTGYTRDEIVGANCRFLQGADTDPEEIARLRACLGRRDTCQFELLNYKKDGTPFWNALHVSPIYDEAGRVAFYFGSQWDITEKVEERRRADLNAERLATALRASRAVGTYDWDVTADVVLVDPPFAEVYGLDPMAAARGPPVDEFFERIDEGDRDRIEAAAYRTVRTGKPFDEEYGIASPSGHRWLLGHGECKRDADGKPTRFSGVVIDITDRRRAEIEREQALERSDLMLREVNHRVKNLFALVPAIVRMSLRATNDTRTMAAQIEARVGALSRSHSLTLGAASAQEGIDIAALVPAVMEPYVAAHDPFVLSGDAQRLREVEANTISLTLHELATNAAKHGGLSVPEGRVHIDWRTRPSGQHPGEAWLDLAWRETGGPKVDGPPAVSGFGTDLIDKLTRGMGAEIERQWPPEGLVVTIRVPIEAGQTDPANG